MIRKCVIGSLMVGGCLGVAMNVFDLAFIIAGQQALGAGSQTMTQALTPIQLALAYIIWVKLP